VLVIAAGALLSRFKIDALLEFLRVVALVLLPLLLVLPPDPAALLLLDVFPAVRQFCIVI